jgi:hypothetical protein
VYVCVGGGIEHRYTAALHCTVHTWHKLTNAAAGMCCIAALFTMIIVLEHKQ